MGDSVQKSIRKMVSRIVKQFDPDQIVLFGSHARGTATLDSDVDLLVVMRNVKSRRAKQVEIRCALHDIRIPRDIIVVTADEVKRQRNVVGTIVNPALREGKVVYARAT